MRIRRFIMEDWLAEHKVSCRYNLGESGMPDITIGELLSICDADPSELMETTLKDNDTRGSERLRKAICDSYSGYVPFENITVTTGTSEALFILFNLLLDEGKNVVLPFPAFQALYEIPRALGAETKFYNLTSRNGFVADTEEICSLIDHDTGVVVINTPHNPSGVLFPLEKMADIAEKTAAQGGYVISDEHYRFLPHDSFQGIPTLAGAMDNVIATGSLTKCFGMIGLRMGWIAAGEGLIGQVRDFRDYLTHTLSPASDLLAAIALENLGRFTMPAIKQLKANSVILENLARANKYIEVVNPQAGVVAFPSFSHHISSDDFARGLLRKGVFVLPGSAFETEGFFRINLGQPTEIFKEALDIIGEYVSELGE